MGRQRNKRDLRMNIGDIIIGTVVSTGIICFVKLLRCCFKNGMFYVYYFFSKKIKKLVVVFNKTKIK
jgi:hypothetical protein